MGLSSGSDGGKFSFFVRSKDEATEGAKRFDSFEFSLAFDPFPFFFDPSFASF